MVRPVPNGNTMAAPRGDSPGQEAESQRMKISPSAAQARTWGSDTPALSSRSMATARSASPLTALNRRGSHMGESASWSIGSVLSSGAGSPARGPVSASPLVNCLRATWTAGYARLLPVHAGMSEAVATGLGEDRQPVRPAADRDGGQHLPVP